MKNNIRITLEYDGSRYDGWQKQGNTDNTIQGKLENVLFRMSGEEIEVHGSGRTDAGVHARGQVANFHINAEICPDGEAAREYLNRYLPGPLCEDRAGTVSQPPVCHIKDIWILCGDRG